MGTKKQEELKKEIFQNTKRIRTLSDVNPSIDLSLLEHFGLKTKFDESKDYFRKTDKEIKLLKEQKKLNEDHLVTVREKKSFIITMMEKMTDAQIESLYKQVEEFVGDGGTV